MPQQPPPPPPPPPPIPLRAHSESLSRQGSSDVPAPRIKTTLVSCFNRMDDDAWASVLLPKLQQDNSMRSLTASCQALKLLCQRFHTRLNLSSLTSNGEPNQVETYTTTLPQRFPAVSSVDLAINRESSYRCIYMTLPALARLPLLTKLSINISGPCNTLAMALQLANLRTLPRLQSLSLVLDHSWEDATEIWQELGRTTQLETLELSHNPILLYPVCRMQDIAALRGLSRLQRLRIDTLNLSRLPAVTDHEIQQLQQRMQAKQSQMDECQRAMQHQATLLQQYGPYHPANPGLLHQMQYDHQYMQHELMVVTAELRSAQAQNARRQQLEASESMDFLQGLTALTSLHLPVTTCRGLESIAACSHLQELKLLLALGRAVTLTAAVCHAVGTLTNLRTIDVGALAGEPMWPHFYNCLKDLKQLSELSANSWVHEALPVLCQLNHLRVIKGGWEGSTQDYSAFICPSVTLLCCTWGDGVPFGSFPSLLCVGQSGSFDANSITALGRHCSFLTSLQLCPGELCGVAPSLHTDTPSAERVSALQALSQLPNLARLEWSLSCDLELGTLAMAGLSSLQQLALHVRTCQVPGAVTLSGLMHLSHVPSIQHLRLYTAHLPLSADFANLLLTLRALPRLSVGVPSSREAAVVWGAVDALQALDMQIPTVDVFYV